ncbi:uncharacterized protein LOC21394394 [Morus notabilis]|uniref:uncharacterized protein LOC21394394 n=1 Tax=Morus notabilis TaxID=981085 RepID=UPI000CED0570|nr:uncharacterized protein LOC21394394 [Morus notabilis]
MTQVTLVSQPQTRTNSLYPSSLAIKSEGESDEPPPNQALLKYGSLGKRIAKTKDAIAKIFNRPDCGKHMMRNFRGTHFGNNVVSIARCAVLEFQKLAVCSEVALLDPPTSVVLAGSPPPWGAIKANFDASIFPNSETCGIGCILRDDSGVVIVVLAKKY